MILIAILDDRQEEIQALETLIKHYTKEKDIPCLIHIYDNGVELIRSRTAYDIVFLEVRTGNMSGMDVAHFLQIINKNVELVFVTHMVQMAIQGYGVGALDFLAKPVTQPVIDCVMDKFLSKISGCLRDYLAVKTTECIVWLSTNSIYYVDVSDCNLIYHTAQGDYRTRGPFKAARKQLECRPFVQCNRSALVNMCHVQSLHDDHLTVNGINIPIVRSHRREVRRTVLHYFGLEENDRTPSSYYMENKSELALFKY